MNAKRMFEAFDLSPNTTLLLHSVGTPMCMHTHCGIATHIFTTDAHSTLPTHA